MIIKDKKRFVLVLLLLVLLFVILLRLKYQFENKHKNTNIDQNQNKTVEIIQLSPQTHRQMMGYVIKTINGKLIVIDGGTSDDKDNLLKTIKNNGSKVDIWFITHAHNDHSGAFLDIMNKSEVEVDKICASLNDFDWYKKYDSERAEFSKELIDLLNNKNINFKVVYPNLNDVFEIDELKVEILGIKNPEITENSGNEQSMVIKFDTGKTSFLVLGDTGIQSSKKLLETQKSKLKSDIVQMSHHGQAGATKELYSQINPTACFWPTTEWLWNNDSGDGYNSGTWKTLETRQWMKELGVNTHYNAKDGDIRIEVK